MEAKNRYEILLVGHEQEEVQANLYAELQARAYGVTRAIRGEDALAKAKHLNLDVIVSELVVPGLSGLELLAQLRSAKPRLPVIVVAESGSTEDAIQATRLGAYDFLAKPFEISEVIELIAQAASRNSSAITPFAPGEAQFAGTGLVGMSRRMQELYKQIGIAADSPDTILIRGATGTGKELVAKAIHQQGLRANGPFIAVNCNALAETLFESELFGHESGAFTGARGVRVGRFEAANHGTLFLDEIGDLRLPLQVKLLRVLQEKTIQRVGGRQEIPLDVRVIAATHCDLENGIQTGLFRQDLYYRLKGFTVRTPELSEHAQDIIDLVRHFLAQFQQKTSRTVSIQRDAIEFLGRQTWPGNVRQLENALRQAATAARNQSITLRDVVLACGQPELAPVSADRPPRDRPGERREPLTDLLIKAGAGQIHHLHKRVVERAERSLFTRAMTFAQFNQAKVARLLGTTRRTVREKVRQFGIWPKEQAELPPPMPRRTQRPENTLL
jgi:DNA-binding NtrC family response regulator